VEQIKDASDMKKFDDDDGNRYINRIIKTNLEVFIASFLQDKQMSGYDLIKEIFLKYNVFLSQGTVYPALYSMAEEGILQAEYSKSDMRSKKYSLTPIGEEIAQKNIEEFVKAMDHAASLVQKGMR
jgi:DNA-binding PadR family transcriptional regulator